MVFRRWLTLLMCGGLWALIAHPRLQAQSRARLTLQIVPTTYSSSSSREPTISFTHPKHFHVLLTNVSATPVALFEEWNSFGYFGLSFRLTYPNGRTVRVTKKPRGWDKNFPSTVTIPPGGFYLFEVDFDPAIWAHSPRLEKPPADEGLRCRLQAVYTIVPQKLSEVDQMWTAKGVSIWTGTLTSTPMAVALWP